MKKRIHTVEQWTEDLRRMPPEELPGIRDWKGSAEEYIAHLAKEYAALDLEVAAEWERLDAMTDEERADDFFRREFNRLCAIERWTEYDRGYYRAMFNCAMAYYDFNIGETDFIEAALQKSSEEENYAH